MTELPVRAPFRLDLTANALRRLSTNIVDRYDPATGYVRAHRGAIVGVRQRHPGASLELEVSGQPDFDPAALVRRMLGADRDLVPFRRAATRLPWLDSLAQTLEGLKPPRYPTLWEAIVNAIVFQQISIHAAGAILRRTIERFSPPQRAGDVVLHPFFEPATILAADPSELRAQGLSINKVTALRACAETLLSGALDETELEGVPTPELIARLVPLRGIGPWTAAVIALRGFGRLDIFPLNDSGVARTIRELSGDDAIDITGVLGTLGDQRGMLYYHLLLGRLANRGQLETAT